jgi:hypothetical protein
VRGITLPHPGAPTPIAEATMQKLSLKLDQLKVDSFEARSEAQTQKLFDTASWSCGSICPTVSDPERCCGSRPY